MKIQILAFAAHPDDIELSCSGTLLLHHLKGYTTGIIDLTAGELGSRGSVELRRQEAKAAAEILGISVRENLQLRDGFFQNNEDSVRKVIEAIRRYQPDIILANALRDRHPDHGRAAQLVRDACFYSGLVKIETQWEGMAQTPWRPKRVFHYIQDTDLVPDFIVDISSTFEKKIESIQAYGSQFFNQSFEGPETYISNRQFIDSIEFRNRTLGKRIGVHYGEGFQSPDNPLGLSDFSGLVLPQMV